jgi:hypothetical protein
MSPNVRRCRRGKSVKVMRVIAAAYEAVEYATSPLVGHQVWSSVEFATRAALGFGRGNVKALIREVLA